MQEYRIYRLNRDGHILRGDYLAATDDAAAIRAVREQAAETSCEIWLGKRRVATVPAGGGEPGLPE